MLKVYNSKRNWKMLQKLWSFRSIQTFFSYGFCNFINTGFVYFDEECVKQALALNEDRTESKEKFILGTMLYSILNHQFNISFPDYVINRMAEEGKIFHVNELKENPYIKNIKIPSLKEGSFEFSQNKFKKYEIFVCDGFYDELINIVLPVIGYIDEEFEFLVLLEKNKVWMAITPSEIVTMQKDIDKAHGKVLTLGCGLGYYAYMTAIKENVESVTIIEKSPEVISLFKKYILPQFSDVRNKITIIEADAIEFMENLEDGKYDYCFADIWESNIDIAPYLKLKPLEKKFKHMECGYWLEFNMIASNIQSLLLMFMSDGLEYKSKMNNLPPQVEPIKKFVEDVYKKDVYIKEPEIIKYYINPHNIIAMINQKYQSE